jgi:hypothetical protein
MKNEASTKVARDEIYKSFSRIIRKLRFKNNGTKIFKDWYIDGRLYIYYEMKDGFISVLRFLDPMKLKFIKEGKEEFLEAGGTNYKHIPCMNDNDDWVDVMVSWINDWKSK